MPIKVFFDHIDMEHLMGRVKYARSRISYLEVAAQSVAVGLHRDVKLLCWECLQIIPASTSCMVCGKCKSAQYCSRKCQLAAWKTGHKDKCDALRSRYTSFQSSLSTIDKMYSSFSGGSNPPTIHNIGLSDEFDYNLLDMIFSMTSPHLETPDGDDIYLQYPSMEVYYQNLGRVIRGEWWFYTNAVYDKNYKRRVQKEVSEEINYFLYLCILLCYDYFQSTKEALQLTEDPSPALVTSRFTEDSFVMTMKEEHGAAMSVERFITIFKGNPNIKCSSSIDRNRLRREVRYRSVHNFVKKFHK